MKFVHHPIQSENHQLQGIAKGNPQKLWCHPLRRAQLNKKIPGMHAWQVGFTRCAVFFSNLLPRSSDHCSARCTKTHDHWLDLYCAAYLAVYVCTCIGPSKCACILLGAYYILSMCDMITAGCTTSSYQCSTPHPLAIGHMYT